MIRQVTRRGVLRAGGSLAAVGLLPSFLAACDDGKDKPTGSPLSLQAAWVNDAEFIGYFVAIAQKFYEAEGLDFRYLPGGPDKVADEVLAAKGCDVALTTPDGTVNAIVRQGAPFKIIGTQYQRSPLGIVTLKNNGISAPKDLVGRSLAVPAANRLTTQAFLKLNGIDPRDVRQVPYQYDPSLLVDGVVDATVDFVTNVPYSIRLRNKEPSSFLFADFGFKMFMDTLVVREETLTQKRKELIAFLRASRRGWEENFRDPTAYPPRFENTWFKGTGRTVDNEKFFNEQQKPLMESPQGIFSMSEAGIEETIASLNAIGLPGTRAMFVTDLLKEI